MPGSKSSHLRNILGKVKSRQRGGVGRQMVPPSWNHDSKFTGNSFCWKLWNLLFEQLVWANTFHFRCFCCVWINYSVRCIKMKYCILVEAPGLGINPRAIKAVCSICILVVFVFVSILIDCILGVLWLYLSYMCLCTYLYWLCFGWARVGDKFASQQICLQHFF